MKGCIEIADRARQRIAELLKERDEALRRGDAYRELAILNLPAKIRYEECKTVDDALNWIDAEAAKILEREAKSPEGKWEK